jgi:hypothetical protein
MGSRKPTESSKPLKRKHDKRKHDKDEDGLADRKENSSKSKRNPAPESSKAPRGHEFSASILANTSVDPSLASLFETSVRSIPRDNE